MFDTAKWELPPMAESGHDESALIDGIAALERLKAAAAARQARLTAALDATRRAAEAAAGMAAGRRGRGVAAEVALARRDSPVRGSRHLGFAKALVHEMPHTLAALEAGALSEWRATIVVRESACLDVDDRRRLDAELCSETSGLDGVGDAALAAAAKAIAYRGAGYGPACRTTGSGCGECGDLRPGTARRRARCCGDRRLRIGALGGGAEPDRSRGAEFGLAGDVAPSVRHAGEERPAR